MSRFNIATPTSVRRSSTIPPPSPLPRRNPFGLGRAATSFGDRLRREAEAARPPMSPQYVTYAYSDNSDISDMEEFSTTESFEASPEHSPAASPQLNPQYSPLPSPDLTPQLSPGKDDRYYELKAREALRGTTPSPDSTLQLSPLGSPRYSPLPSPDLTPELSPGKDDRYYMLQAMEALRASAPTPEFQLSPQMSPDPNSRPSSRPNPQPKSQLSPQMSPEPNSRPSSRPNPQPKSQLSPRPSPVNRPNTPPNPVIVRATKPPIRKASKPIHKKGTEQININGAVYTAPILPTAAEDMERLRVEAGYDSDDDFFDTKDELLHHAVRDIKRTDKGLKSLINSTHETVADQSDCHTITIKIPKMIRRQGNNWWKLNWLGFILAIFVTWFVAESAVCQVNCRPTMSRGHSWKPGQPSFGLSLPYQLDDLTGQVVSRSWGRIDRALGPRRGRVTGNDWLNGRSEPVGVVPDPMIESG